MASSIKPGTQFVLDGDVWEYVKEIRTGSAKLEVIKHVLRRPVKDAKGKTVDWRQLFVRTLPKQVVQQPEPEPPKAASKPAAAAGKPGKE